MTVDTFGELGDSQATTGALDKTWTPVTSIEAVAPHCVQWAQAGDKYVYRRKGSKTVCGWRAVGGEIALQGPHGTFHAGQPQPNAPEGFEDKGLEWKDVLIQEAPPAHCAARAAFTWAQLEDFVFYK